MLRSLSLSSVLLVTSVAAFAAEPETKPDASADRPHIKVFRLKNVNPNDALEAFNALLGRQADVVPLVPPAMDLPVLPGGPFPGGLLPPVPTPLNPAALPPPQGINFQFGEQPVAFQQQGLEPILPAPAPTPVVAPPAVTGRALADPRTRSLIVRGTEKELQLAADLVAVLNTPEDKPLPAVKSLKAFRFQHLDTKDFVGIMQQLDPNIGYRLAPIGRMKLLLAVASDEQMKELAEAVKELDIPTKTK
jgi:hypothetical protein